VSDLRTRLDAALGSSYRIEKELGGGGMSRVFLADEVELGRQVVIKVLPPEMAASVNQDRFRREVQLAARLQHPHIVPLLAAGSAGDVLYYVMPYIKGESLRAKLVREGELPVGETVRILREVSDALAYAHAEGVVHRDIKPDNVMISSGHALVTDFGVAKAVTASAGESGLTSLGMALGTPAYMAPEQAAADPHVDHRADLYALGAMAYEMLAGQPPFTAPTAQALLAAQVTQTPERVGVRRPTVPAALDALVMRCLEKRPADRWQQAGELLPHLDALLTPSGGTAPTGAIPPISSGTEAALRQAHPVRVAVLFGIAALAVLTTTWWLVQKLGLPDWVVLAAGALLVLGLPIMLFAARNERRRLLARSQGAAVPAPTGLIGRLSTVRGALAGGGLAFTGLVVGAAAFMALRTAGVGPFATLVTAGKFKERDRLVVAEFQTAPEDSAIAASITEALKIDLGQSPMVRLLEGRQIAEALVRMQKPTGTRLDAATAQDLAQREGAKAVVAGEVSRLGAGYVLSVRLVSTADGATLLGARESAADQAQLIAAVDRISKKLREGIGESLQSIRSGEPLEQVTTASLEALRLYTQAQAAVDAGRIGEPVRLFEQAIALDSGFAMAWRKLAVELFNQRVDPARQLYAAKRAYDLRERLPRSEADLATAYYFQSTGNRPEAIQAYERMLATWPDHGAARNNLALLLNQEQRYPEAERMLRAAVDSGATTRAIFDNLIDAQLFQHEYAAAESTVARYARTVPGAREQRNYFASNVAFTTGRYDQARQLYDSLGQSSNPAWRRSGTEGTARLLALQGRIREALQVLGRGRELATPPGAAANGDRLGIEARIANIEAFTLGRPEDGIKRLDAALARYPLDSVPVPNRGYPFLISVAAALGRSALAERLYAEFTRAIPESARRPDGDAAWVEASLAEARGRWGEMLAQGRTAQQRWGCEVCSLPKVAWAFERLNQPDSALAAYEQYLATPMYFDLQQETDIPLSLRRLGELYERKGDKAKALEYYGRLVDLWKNADPELQPRVKDLRRRIGDLAGEPKP
jgi:tetratricopeptide (TPR) repeat protein/tRNA A-37 threonylcarbamoyl transferase component Bud32